MKLFIKKTLYILIIFLIADIIFILIINSFYNDISFEISQDKNILVIGSSRGQNAVNDAIVKNVYNISHEGELYLYTYVKLRKFIEVNPKIDTILVTYSYLTPGYCNSIITDFKVKQFTPILYPWFNIDEWKIFYKNIDFWKSISKSPYTQVRLLVEYNRKQKDLRKTELGGFISSTRNKLKEDLERRKNVKEGIIDKCESKNLVLEYINKINNYCNQNNVKLILTHYPVYNPAITESESIRYKEYHKKYLSQIPLLDFTKLNFPAENFGDVDHMNHIGATELSNLIEEKGLKNLLEQYGN